MTVHPEVRVKLVAYVDGTLGPEEASSVSAHLSGCDSCSAEEEKVRRTISMVRAGISDEPPEGYWSGFVPRLRVRLEGPSPVRRLVPAFGVTVAAVLALLILFRPSGKEEGPLPDLLFPAEWAYEEEIDYGAIAGWEETLVMEAMLAIELELLTDMDLTWLPVLDTDTAVDPLEWLTDEEVDKMITRMSGERFLRSG